jgi:hypothetical protein
MHHANMSNVTRSKKENEKLLGNWQTKTPGRHIDKNRTTKAIRTSMNSKALRIHIQTIFALKRLV